MKLRQRLGEFIPPPIDNEGAKHQEHALGAAITKFIGPWGGDVEGWQDVAGDYLLRIIGESKKASEPIAASEITPFRFAIPIGPQPPPNPPAIVVSISAADDKPYGLAREGFYVAKGGGSIDAKSLSTARLLLSGVCAYIGTGQMLVLMRDFSFSHLYTLSREAYGFSGTMMRLPLSASFATRGFFAAPQYHFDIELHRLPSR